MSLHVSRQALGQVSRLGLVLLALVVLVSCKSEEEQVADFLARGREHVEAKQDKEAVIEFRNVIKVDPNNAEGHYALAEAYLRQGQLKQGYWELRETVRLDPSNMEARLRFGTISIAARDFEEVLAQGTALTEADPENANGWSLRAQALEGLDRAEEAEEFYLKAIELAPENPDSLVALSRYYGRAGRMDDAEQALLRFAELEPGYRSSTHLARFYTSTKRYAESENYVRLALEAEGTTGRQEAAYVNYANFLQARDRADEARALLEQGIEKLEEKTALLYALARLFGSRGAKDKADALIEQAARENPDDPNAQLVLSSYRSSRGDLPGALAAAERALEIDPEHLTARLRKAELLIDVGYREQDVAKVAAGRSIVDEVLREQPSNPSALFVRAKLELAEGAPESAVVSLRAAIDGKPNWAQAHFVLGSALALRNDKSGARMELARALELDANMHEARKALARIHSELGEHEYAIEQGQLYLEQRPDDSLTRIMVAQSLVRLGKLDDGYEVLQQVAEEERDAELVYALARIQMGRGKLAEAHALLLEVNALREHEYDILRSIMMVEARLDKLADSVARIDAAIVENPTSSRLVQLRGEAALGQGDVEAAEAAFKQSIELNPENISAYSQLASLYQRTGRLEETIAAYTTALEVQPENAQMHHVLGVLYEYREEISLAMEQYELAITYDPALGDAKNNLAYLLAERGETLDRALDLAQEAKALLPDSPNTADTLGWVLYKRGVASAAVGYLREAEAGMNPEDQSLGVVRHHLALAYEENGESDKAIESLDRAIASLDAARAAGQENEPAWAAEVRSMRARLVAAEQS